jgi:hypothetical protein
MDVAELRAVVLAHDKASCCSTDQGGKTARSTLRVESLNWSLNPLCYAGTVREAFARVVCMGVLVVASLAGCTAPLSQPEVHQATAADPLILPPATLLLTNQR